MPSLTRCGRRCDRSACAVPTSHYYSSHFKSFMLFSACGGRYVSFFSSLLLIVLPSHCPSLIASSEPVCMVGDGRSKCWCLRWEFIAVVVIKSWWLRWCDVSSSSGDDSSSGSSSSNSLSSGGGGCLFVSLPYPVICGSYGTVDWSAITVIRTSRSPDGITLQTAILLLLLCFRTKCYRTKLPLTFTSSVSVRWKLVKVPIEWEVHFLDV